MPSNVLSLTDSQVNFSKSTAVYQSECSGKRLSPRTLQTQGYAFKSLLGFLERDDFFLSEIDSSVMRDYMGHIAETIAPATANRYVSTLKCFFQFCIQEGYIETDPMANLKRPKVPDTVIVPLSLEQVESVLTVCGNAFCGIRDRAIVMTLYDCGLRATELCNLTDKDILWEESEFIIRHTKNGHPRRVPFSEVTAKAIRSYILRRGDLVCDKLFVTNLSQPLTRNRLQKIIQGLGDKAKIPHLHPHQFRHTFAVSFLRNGGDVFSLQKILGHSTLEMTRHYSNLADTDIQEKHKIASPADRLSLKAQGTRNKRIK